MRGGVGVGVRDGGVGRGSSYVCIGASDDEARRAAGMVSQTLDDFCGCMVAVKRQNASWTLWASGSLGLRRAYATCRNRLSEDFHMHPDLSAAVISHP